MNENDDLTNCLRAFTEALPQEPGPSVQQMLLARFRERRDNKRRKAYIAGLAASLAAAIGIYLTMPHPETSTRSVQPSPGTQPSGFISLPYAQSGVPLEQPVIVRVTIPVSELGSMGVPLTPFPAKGSVRADLLVGQDGVARAVRFVE